MTTPDLQLMASQLQYAQPATYPAIRRSAYLADALENLQDTGADNLRTPTALWGKLAAQLLLQGARDSNFNTLQKQLTADQSGMMGALMQGLPGHETSAASPGAPSAAAIGAALSPTPSEPSPTAMLDRADGGAPAAPPSGGASHPPPAQQRQYLTQPGRIRDQEKGLPTAPPPEEAQAFAPQAPRPAQQPAAPTRTTPTQGRIPTQPILPEELAQLAAWTKSPYPQVRAKALELAARLQQRRVSPVELERGWAYGPDGQAYSLTDRYVNVPSQSPGETAQLNLGTGKVEYQQHPTVMGTAEPGTVRDPASGAYVKAPTTVGDESFAFGTPNADQVIKMSTAIMDRDAIARYMTLRNKAATVLEPHAAGIDPRAADINLIDVANTALSNNPDLAVSEGFFKAVGDMQGGVPAFIAQLKNNIAQTGALEPKYREGLKHIIAVSLDERYKAANLDIQSISPGYNAAGFGKVLRSTQAQIPPPIAYHPQPSRPPAGVRQPPPPGALANGGQPLTPEQAAQLPPNVQFRTTDGRLKWSAGSNANGR